MFFKKLVDKKKDKVKCDIIPKTNEEYISVTYGCFRCIDGYRFLSSSLDSLVKTPVDHDLKKLKKLKKGIVCDNKILNNVNEFEKLLNKGENNKTIEKLKKKYPDKKDKLEESLLNYMGKMILKL